VNRAFAMGFAAIAMIGATLSPMGAQTQVELKPGADRQHWESWFEAGVDLLRRRPALALDAFRQASRLDPSRAEPLYGQYVAYWMNENYEEYLVYLEGNRAIRRKPEVQRADSLRILALHRNPFVHTGINIVLIDRMPGSWGRRADTRAWIHYAGGRFAESVRAYEEWVARDKEQKRWAVWALAISRVGSGDLSGAVSDFRWIVDLMNREQESAEEVYYYESKELLLYSIGLIEWQRRDLAAARAAFGEATVENAGFALAHAAIGMVERAERKFPAAIAAYAQAVELAPADAVLRAQYAQVLLDAGRYELAVAEAQLAAEREPMWATPLHIIARSRERQGRVTQANDAYLLYLSKAPRNDPQARAIRQRLGITEP
jgi:tetratricopeptide (TPR) repeat protein